MKSDFEAEKNILSEHIRLVSCSEEGKT